VIEIAEDFHRRLQLINVGVTPEPDSKLKWFMRHRLVENSGKRYALTMLGQYVMMELAQEIQNERSSSASA
jgi:predicted transcriptional regulator